MTINTMMIIKVYRMMFLLCWIYSRVDRNHKVEGQTRQVYHIISEINGEQSISNFKFNSLTECIFKENKILNRKQNIKCAPLSNSLSVKPVTVKLTPNRVLPLGKACNFQLKTGFCLNGRECVKSKGEIQVCQCGNYYSGEYCETSKDLYTVLKEFCATIRTGSIPRYGGNVQSSTVFAWRCYTPQTLTSDTYFYNTIKRLTQYFTRRQLESLVDGHPEVKGLYFVGKANQSCREVCNALGREVSCQITTAQSTYFFKLGGKPCTPTFVKGDGWSNPVHPYVSDRCHGFLGIPQTYDCFDGKLSNAQRLCKCLQPS